MITGFNPYCNKNINRKMIAFNGDTYKLVTGLFFKESLEIYYFDVSSGYDPIDGVTKQTYVKATEGEDYYLGLYCLGVSTVLEKEVYAGITLDVNKMSGKRVVAFMNTVMPDGVSISETIAYGSTQMGPASVIETQGDSQGNINTPYIPPLTLQVNEPLKDIKVIQSELDTLGITFRYNSKT